MNHEALLDAFAEQAIKIVALEARLAAIEGDRGIEPSHGTRRVFVADLVRWAAHETGIAIREICGPQRSKGVFWIRAAIVWVARRVCGASLPQIGRVLGNRDHTTILHAWRRADERRAEDGSFAALCDQMLRAHGGEATAA